jgi:hypothetical protein
MAEVSIEGRVNTVSVRWGIRRAGLAAGACLLLVALGGVAEAQAGAGYAQQKPAPPEAKVEASPLVIDTALLPETYPHANYSMRLQQHGGTPPVHWKVEKGALPPGLKLEDDGTLHGTPEKEGEYRVTISVTDNSQPAQTLQREYVLNVVAAMTLRWKTPAHVSGNRIDGTVEVSNTTADDIDLTYDVKAVAENGRATEIGYQHFLLHPGTVGMELPFGETLPRGAYVVYVNAVGEVDRKKAIYRQRMQTPAALQVAVGP